jgi:hypothetical protein
MKSKTQFLVVILFLFVSILYTSCSKEVIKTNLDLENTSWKLTNETWSFPNGKTQIFSKSNEGDGIFIWYFESNSIAKVHHKPYEVIENANWQKDKNTLTIKTINSDSSFTIRHYTIIELTEITMKLNVEEINGASSHFGIANKITIELKNLKP